LLSRRFDDGSGRWRLCLPHLPRERLRTVSNLRHLHPQRRVPLRTRTGDGMKFNTKVLKKVLTYPIESFEKLGKVTNSGGGRWGDERHIYIDRGSNVLGVAHLDSVQTPNHFWINQDYIVCPTIDNRLGAWLMLYGLPSLGVVVDVLLT